MNEEILEYILDQMTLDEKLAQLTQLTSNFFAGSNDKSDPTGLMNELGINKEIIHNCGSVLGASGAKEIICIQREHLRKSRISIPCIYCLYRFEQPRCSSFILLFNKIKFRNK